MTLKQTRYLFFTILLIIGFTTATEKEIKGWLGVVVEDMSPAMLIALGVENGVLVSDVIINSPAAKAGLKMGDVIVQVAGKRIVNYAGLQEVVAERPGEVVEIVIVRRLEEHRLKAELARRAGIKDKHPKEFSEGLQELMRNLRRFFRKVEPQLRGQQENYQEALDSLQAQIEKLQDELERLR